MDAEAWYRSCSEGMLFMIGDLSSTYLFKQNFYERLKDHLLGRLLGHDYDGDEQEFTVEDRNSVVIEHHRIYIHRTIRINHTTYDVRRNQDTVNPRTHCDIMTLAHEEGEENSLEDHSCNKGSERTIKNPFWYARVLGIYHARVTHIGPNSKDETPQDMDFLWVRWFGAVMDKIPSGWSARRLPLIGFVPQSDPYAFGFLNPAEVIRSVHLMPAFHYGRTKNLLCSSIARRPEEKDEDWQFYYVGRLVP